MLLRGRRSRHILSDLIYALLIKTSSPNNTNSLRRRRLYTAMLLRAARSPCWRASRRLALPGYTVLRSTQWPAACHGTRLRIFSSLGSPRRKQETGDTAPGVKTASISSTPASSLTNADEAQKAKVAKIATPAKKPDLLSEATVGNKEQRKADWAIMKEMTKYLWPKVCVCA